MPHSSSPKHGLLIHVQKILRREVFILLFIGGIIGVMVMSHTTDKVWSTCCNFNTLNGTKLPSNVLGSQTRLYGNQSTISSSTHSSNMDVKQSTIAVTISPMEKHKGTESHMPFRGSKSAVHYQDAKRETPTKKGSNGLPICPVVPPVLVGRVKVTLQKPSFEELAAEFKDLDPGGHYKPPNCISRHKVALIIPYRDREEHLRIFLKHLHPILQRQLLDYQIYVIEQSAKTTFNRGMLINIGVVEATKLYDWQCFIMHDIDLLPEDDRNLYTCPTHPRHMSVAVDKFGYRLPYVGIFGGVSALKIEDFKAINGFSNQFFGWGGEDDDLFNRLKFHGYQISRYPAEIARYRMIRHQSAKENPDRFHYLNTGRLRFNSDGLNSLQYKVLRIEKKKLYTKIQVNFDESVMGGYFDYEEQEGFIPKTTHKSRPTDDLQNN